MTSVIIVDDQSLVRAGLRLILDQSTAIEVVGEAADGREALDMVARLRPDVALMDIRMPVMDGIEATRRIAATGAGTRVLTLTTFGEDQQVAEALRAGASGFLLKDVDPPDLLHAITVVARGGGTRCSRRPSCAGSSNASPRCPREAWRCWTPSPSAKSRSCGSSPVA